MKLGFYYHVPVHESFERIRMPAFLGLFIDSIAAEVEQLVLFLHSSDFIEGAEYELRSSNIIFINLGKPSSAYHRFYAPSITLAKYATELKSVDFMLVRAPSPLAPAFGRYVLPEKLIYLLVGSYKEGSKHLKGPWYKLWAIKLLNHHMHYRMQQMLRGKHVLVNSHQLLLTSKHLAKSVKLINTTTLKSEDFFRQDDTCQGNFIKLLFVGRIDIAKGLRECIQVCSQLLNENINCTLTIVGWEERGNTTTEILRDLVSKLGLKDHIFFEGRKSSGGELFNYYRTHDIYLLPSYHEGFPRTIWEALANCIPVIATTVGSIPDFLMHGENAYLIPPESTEELKLAIKKIANDKTLRKKLILNGYGRVLEIRLDIQAKRIVEFISNA